MKKAIFLLVSVVLISGALFAQHAQTGTIELDKAARPCVTAEYNYTADLVEGALKKKFSDLKLGSGERTKDGFRLFEGVTIAEIARERMDVYYKIEDKKQTTVVYMLTSKGYDNFMKMDADSMAVGKTMHFLEAFDRDIALFQLNNQINAQDKVIADIEKKSAAAVKEGESLQNKKARLESSIDEHTLEVSALKTEMEHQQRALELVKTKTATVDQMKDLKKEVNAQEKLTAKATRKYEGGVEDNADRKQDLAETERAINDNLAEQGKLKADLEAAKAKHDDLKKQLDDLR